MGVGSGASDFLFVTPFFLALGGAVVTIASRSAQQAVREAAAREHSEYLLRERQLRTILDARMAAVGNLATGVLHEVNNPVGAIRTTADTADRALGKLRESTGPDARVLGIVAQSLQMIQEVLAPEGAAFEVNSSTGSLVDGDHRALIDALTTVVGRSVDAVGGEGTVRVHLEARDGWVPVTVKDTGKALTAEERSSLFDIGFAEGERTEASFGMPICQSLMHQHGGEIHVLEVAEGSRIEIRLPVAAGDDD